MYIRPLTIVALGLREACDYGDIKTSHTHTHAHTDSHRARGASVTNVQGAIAQSGRCQNDDDEAK